MSKQSSIAGNKSGGVDLITEGDSGNEVRIRTGSKKYSLEFWRQLKDLCNIALLDLNDET